MVDIPEAPAEKRLRKEKLFRDAYNDEYRIQRGLSPLPDLAPPSPEPPKPFDSPSLLARRIAREDGSESEQNAVWGELKRETETLLNARDGDTRMLTTRLHQGMATFQEQKLAADLIDGKIKREPHRPVELRIRLRREMAIKFIAAALQKGLPSSTIVAETHKRFGNVGLSRTIVHALIKKLKAPPAPSANQRTRKLKGKLKRMALAPTSDKEFAIVAGELASWLAKLPETPT
jgi:hypothetical protein